ncbi:MAG: hypothetical protein IIB43_09545 [Candidatus Marinimicrobia bacterium]|nr:hypothetical protein [Candidatus Neomarinimicrobiota bacterium]
MTAIIALATAGQTHPGGVLYSTLLTDDSDHDFALASALDGGKLTYVINNVCIPVNELIDFKSTWDKHAH